MLWVKTLRDLVYSIYDKKFHARIIVYEWWGIWSISFVWNFCYKNHIKIAWMDLGRAKLDGSNHVKSMIAFYFFILDDEFWLSFATPNWAWTWRGSYRRLWWSLPIVMEISSLYKAYSWVVFCSLWHSWTPMLQRRGCCRFWPLLLLPSFWAIKRHFWDRGFIPIIPFWWDWPSGIFFSSMLWLFCLLWLRAASRFWSRCLVPMFCQLISPCPF